MRQFQPIAAAVSTMRAASIVLDAELVAIGADGKPDFDALMRRRPEGVRLYVFDLLFIDSLDVRDVRLVYRKTLARAQIESSAIPSCATCPPSTKGWRFSRSLRPWGWKASCRSAARAHIAPARRVGGERSRPGSGARQTRSAGGFSNGGEATDETGAPGGLPS